MRTSLLSFANLASVTALAVALAGGGYAVASQHLPRNSVGSPQVKNGAVKSKDLKDGAVTGADVAEATLAEVPLAASVKTVQSARVTAAAGQTVELARRSGMVLNLVCTDQGSNKIEAVLSLSTTVPDVKVSVSDGADAFHDLDPGEAPQAVVSVLGSFDAIRDGSFAALTGAGASWQGSGFVVNHYQGGTGCLAEMTFVG